VRQWLRTLPGFDIGSSDLEEIDFWTLRFNSCVRERAFLLARQSSVASGTFKTAFLLFLHIALAWATTGFDWPSSVRTFYPDSTTVAATTARNIFTIALGTIALSCAILSKLRRFRSLLGPAGFEHYVATQLFLVIVLICFQSPWYVARLFGLDAEVVCTNPAIEDLYLLLSLDCIVTASHIAIPVRWFSLLPMELAVCMGYGLFASVIGSRMYFSSVLLNFVMITALTMAASLGKRRSELQERASFVREVREKSLRVEMEFRLSKSESEHHERRTTTPKRDADQMSCPTSAPTTNFTGLLFEGMDGLNDQEIRVRLLEIAKFGQSEHWLIAPEDLTAHPSRMLGSGGFGMVMAASYHGATIALKATLASELPGHDISSIANELRMLRRLRHPNIVLFYGACVVPETAELTLVMECVRGTSLDAFVVAPPNGPSTADRCKLADDVCSALIYMHAQTPRLVHGDVKDSNTLVERHWDGRVNAKLLDFGLGRILTKRAKPMGGTIVWQAPELLCRSGVKPATSADVFSFGRLLFKLASGQRPFAGLKQREILHAARSDIGVSLNWLDVPLKKEFKDIAERCTQTAFGSRPSMAQVQELLRESAAEHLPPMPELPLHVALGKAREDIKSKDPSGDGSSRKGSSNEHAGISDDRHFSVQDSVLSGFSYKEDKALSSNATKDCVEGSIGMPGTLSEGGHVHIPCSQVPSTFSGGHQTDTPGSQTPRVVIAL